MDNTINNDIIQKAVCKSVAIYKAIAMLPPPEIKDLWAENNYTKQNQNNSKQDEKDNCVTTNEIKSVSTKNDLNDITKRKPLYLYLMIKTHKLTGKKYLCKKQTTSDDRAIKYCGSGLKWKQHLKEYGKDVDTQIIYKCSIENKYEFRKIAIDYSQQFDIVNSPDWLNVIVEEGQGGSRTETNGTRGKKWIFKDNERKLVSVDDLESYINSGWQIGFPEHFNKLMSDIRKGKPAWNKGVQMKLPEQYKSKKKYQYIPKKKLTSEQRSLISKEILNRPDIKAKFTQPRKPLVTAQNISTGEIKTLGRYEWYKQHRVNYKRLLKNINSNGWKMVGLAGLEPTTNELCLPL